MNPRTPVLVAVGQVTERIDDPGYRGMSSVELATAAASAALADTGVDPATVAGAIDTVVGLRQFEISGRGMAPLGCSTNYPRSVAQRIDAAPSAMNIAFMPNPPVDAGRIIELIQRNRDIKLIGNEKLRIERSTSSAQDRARMIRDILRHIALAPRAVAA